MKRSLSSAIGLVGLLAACSPDQNSITGPAGTTRVHPDVQTTVVEAAPALLRSGVSASLCAAVINGSSEPGTRVVTWGCDASQPTRLYALRSDGLITIGDGTRCLDVMPPKNKGGEVVTWTCAPGEATQHWTLTAAGELTNVQGLCLTVAYEDAQPGRVLVLWTCDGSAGQKWTVAAPTSTPSVVAADPTVGSAELPRTYLNTSMPAPTGRTITVPAGGDLQGALNAALPGDQVLLPPGATYVGNYVLPYKAGMTAGQWITVRTAGPLPAEGTRVSLADAAQLPKILTPNAAAAIATTPGTQGWRLTGLEIGVTPGMPLTYGILTIGDAGGAQNTLAQVPSRIVVDRSFVHGTPTVDVRRCISLNGASVAVIDSYVSDCHSHNGDSQALMGWNGPGPFKIVNNRLEGAHENIAFGGSDPSISGLIPSDIEIRRNYVMKPLSWKGVWTAKNLVEIKSGQRVLMEGNVFENNWIDGQQGLAFLWWSANADGGALWSVTQDITFRNNVVRNVPGGFNLTDRYNASLPRMSRVTITNNLITGIDPSNGRLYQINGTVAGVTIANNTGFGINHDVAFVTPDQPLSDLVFRNNVTGAQYTLFAAGYMGNTAVGRMGIPAGNVTGNVFASGSGPSAVPSNNGYAASQSAIGFVNLAGGDLRLSSTSPFLTSGTGGTQPGANFTTLNQITAGVAQ